MECLNKVHAHVQKHHLTKGLFCFTFYNDERNAMYSFIIEMDNQMKSYCELPGTHNVDVHVILMFFKINSGQTVYGRVSWNPEQDLKSAYKLSIQKVYLCAGTCTWF